MPYVAERPVVIVEGHGDIDSVSALIRRISHNQLIFNLSPVSPSIRGGALGKFRNIGQLGRYVRLAALRPEADSILIAVDCDDDCAKVEVAAMTAMLRPLAEELQMKIGVCFFVREFECLFLHCLDDLAARYDDLNIQLPCPVSPEKIESVRDAKGLLSRQMLSGSYKETRDQAKFVHALDIDKLISQSRTTQHIVNCVRFFHDNTSTLVYPA